MNLRISAAANARKRRLSPSPASALGLVPPLFHKVVRLALILASTSPIRRQMLDAAGVEYRSVAPEVDEGAVKAGVTIAAQIAARAGGGQGAERARATTG